MKKLLILSVVLISLLSCEKETITKELPIVASKCNDGSIQPGSNACGTYVLTTNGISVTLNRGGVMEYIRSDKTFCQLFPNHISCLGRNY